MVVWVHPNSSLQMLLLCDFPLAKIVECPQKCPQGAPATQILGIEVSLSGAWAFSRGRACPCPRYGRGLASILAKDCSHREREPVPNFLQGLVLIVALAIAGLGWRMVYQRYSAGMIQNAQEAQQARETSSAPSPLVVRPRPFVKRWYAYNEPLPAGYKCSGADGMVYRAVPSADGAKVLEPLMAGMEIARCGGDSRSSHRWTPPSN
jgi:hypothetical protein